MAQKGVQELTLGGDYLGELSWEHMCEVSIYGNYNITDYTVNY